MQTTLITAAILLLLVAVVGTWFARESRDAERQREAREAGAHLQLQLLPPERWATDTPRGPVTAMVGEITNIGSAQSGLLTIEAEIDNRPVGRSAGIRVSARVVRQVPIVMDTPEPLRGVVTIRLRDASGKELATAGTRLSSPATGAGR